MRTKSRCGTRSCDPRGFLVLPRVVRPALRTDTAERAMSVVVFVMVSVAIAAEGRAQTRPSPPPDPITVQETVQVTATRFGEPVGEVPGSIAVVTGDELRSRGATD